MANKEEIRKIDDQIEKKKEEIWQLQLKKRELQPRILLKGLPNTKN